MRTTKGLQVPIKALMNDDCMGDLEEIAKDPSNMPRSESP